MVILIHEKTSQQQLNSTHHHNPKPLPSATHQKAGPYFASTAPTPSPSNALLALVQTLTDTPIVTALIKNPKKASGRTTDAAARTPARAKARVARRATVAKLVALLLSVS